MYPYYGNPYWYWWYLPAWFDPVALTYSMSYLWFYWIAMMYYIEMFRALIEAWRKFVEKGVATPAT